MTYIITAGDRNILKEPLGKASDASVVIENGKTSEVKDKKLRLIYQNRTQPNLILCPLNRENFKHYGGSVRQKLICEKLKVPFILRVLCYLHFKTLAKGMGHFFQS